MPNRPYHSETTNMYAESNFTTCPVICGQNNLLVSQGQQRRLYDTTSTTVANNPQQFQCYGNYTPLTSSQYGQPVAPQQVITPQLNQPPQQYQNGYFTSQRQGIPGGYSYTFSTLPPPQQMYTHQPSSSSPLPPMLLPPVTNPQMHENPLSLQQQLILKQLEKQRLEMLILHDIIRKSPFNFQFHYDCQTQTINTGDLPTKPQDKGAGTICTCKNEAFKEDLVKIDNTTKKILCPSAFETSLSQKRSLNLKKASDLEKPEKDMATFMHSYIHETKKSDLCRCINKGECLQGPIAESTRIGAQKSVEVSCDLNVATKSTTETQCETKNTHSGVQCNLVGNNTEYLETLIGELLESAQTMSESDSESEHDQSCDDWHSSNEYDVNQAFIIDDDSDLSHILIREEANAQNNEEDKNIPRTTANFETPSADSNLQLDQTGYYTACDTKKQLKRSNSIKSTPSTSRKREEIPLLVKKPSKKKDEERRVSFSDATIIVSIPPHDNESNMPEDRKKKYENEKKQKKGT